MSKSKLDRQWSICREGVYRVYQPSPTTRMLAAGCYTPSLDSYGAAVFSARSLNTDELIDFSGSLADRIVTEIDHFWTSGGKFRQLGFLHRRGYLFYGKQGGGKTSLVHRIVARVIEQGHVAFFCQRSYQFAECIKQFRELEPHRPVVCVFEDIDAIIDDDGDSDLLQWLDGSLQIDKAVNIATTNYPERLDPRIIARPRRFDRVVRIDSPDAGLRDAYLARKLPELPGEERRRWVELSAGLTFAALAEMIISVYCLEEDLEDTAARLRKLDTEKHSSSEFENMFNEAQARFGDQDSRRVRNSADHADDCLDDPEDAYMDTYAN